MIASRNRQVATALIPWVFALVALLGCNAMAPNAVAMRKGKYLDGSCVSQVSVETAPAGSISTPLVFLLPDPADGTRLNAPPSTRLGIDGGRSRTEDGVCGGEARGRAPPVMSVS